MLIEPAAPHLARSAARQQAAVVGDHRATLRRDPPPVQRKELREDRLAVLLRRAQLERATLQRDLIDDFVAGLTELSDLTTIGALLPDWDPPEHREKLARHLERLPPAGPPGSFTRLKDLALVLGASEAMRAHVRARELMSATSLSEVVAILLSAGCERAAVWRLGRRWGVTLKSVLPGLVALDGMTAHDVRAWVALAPSQEREEVWRDTGVLHAIRSGDRTPNKDLYLALLPALGIHVDPVEATAKPHHMRASKADEHIRAFLQTIGQVVPPDRRVEGEVSVVGSADYQLAYDRQWGVYPEYAGLAAEDICNAFVDVDLADRHIWIHTELFSAGTMVHEGMHKYSDDALRKEMRKHGAGGVSQLDEGITELFARKTCELRGVERWDAYAKPHKLAVLLEKKVTQPVVANAYYQGAVAALVQEFERTTGEKWVDFAEAVEAKDWSGAKALLQPL